MIPQKGTVNAHYVAENGNVIADLETTTGDVGTSYKTIQKIVDGYTFKEVKGDNVDGLYINGTLNVTYIYSPKNTPTPEKPVPTPTPETPTPENPTPETPTLPQTGIQANDTGAMILIAGVLVCVGSLLNQKNRKGQS
ncbi:MucBP domain-containing protein [Erysipelothrix piscisicarius]|uniref:MucBP domain-containing protein n=1 Tax=Erysipelothrix piscisicarius TaxID=2485784 RepID=UPI001E650D21|nr:MucBP domain-containing protein [Erysipelothrix piscisicarius]